MARLVSSVRAHGRTRSRAVLANGPSRRLVTARCASQRETVLLEPQQGVVAEKAADDTSYDPFHASKQGGHVVAPVADRADGCMPPLVAMPITQPPDPVPHELANGAPASIVVNRHDCVGRHRCLSSRSPRVAIVGWCIAPQVSHSAHEPSWPFGVDSRAENFGVPAKDPLISRDHA
jgi:hypothetical protein